MGISARGVGVSEKRTGDRGKLKKSAEKFLRTPAAARCLFAAEGLRWRKWMEIEGLHKKLLHYRTSYNEYIGLDGWSGWSTETDTFISEVFEAAKAEAEKREKISRGKSGEELAQALEKKFGKKEK
jgi:hypothetical protein